MILTSLFTLLVICALVFVATYGLTWGSLKLFAPNRKFDKLKVLILAGIVSAAISFVIIVALAIGFSSLPNQQ